MKMSLVREKRKRKENLQVSVVLKRLKNLRNCKAAENAENDEVVSNKLVSEQNGVCDSHSSEKENSISKVNSIESETDKLNNFEHNDEPMQSYLTKFTKAKNSIKSDISNENKHTCFACKLKDDNLVNCSVESCDKFYHSKCLEKLPTSKVESSACPLHLCLSCYNANPKTPQISKGQMYKCFKCPTAFHAKEECTIPGSVILTHEVMSCPDHFSPEKLREYPAVMNLLFCVQCGCNTNLIFCEFCPLSIHKHCIKEGSFLAGKYVCNRCDSRKILFYDDIVWAKICNFRWWPARILNPKEIPADVQKIKHFDGEFPVQFFETGECFWTQKGRVFPFTYKNIGFEDADISHNFKKQMQDIVFDTAINLAREAVKTKKFAKQTDGSNKKPPPYKHIKINRPIGNVQIYTLTDVNDYTMCGCRAEDKNPCGYGTLCLNRSMCAECLSDVCEAGNRCQNKKFQKREYATVKPFYTVTRGWGLKCLEDIKEGNFVIEYVGDLIDEEECEKRIEEKNVCGDNNFYFCTLDATRIIDAGPKGNFSRFLNHSCEPNCETQKWNVNGDVRVGIFAKKDIQAGSELTFDYQMDFSHNQKLQCNCGSQRCSGLIGKKPQNGTSNFSALPKMKELTNGSKLNLKKSENNTLKKDKPLCFKCKKGGKFLTCTNKSCKKCYHFRCLTNIKVSKPSSKNWECPIHFCKKCKLPSEYQCFDCPRAYCKKHADNIVTQSKIFACSKHQKFL